jgi:hypothetical protein
VVPARSAARSEVRSEVSAERSSNAEETCCASDVAELFVVGFDEGEFPCPVEDSCFVVESCTTLPTGFSAGATTDPTGVDFSTLRVFATVSETVAVAVLPTSRTTGVDSTVEATVLATGRTVLRTSWVAFAVWDLAVDAVRWTTSRTGVTCVFAVARTRSRTESGLASWAFPPSAWAIPVIRAHQIATKAPRISRGLRADHDDRPGAVVGATETWLMVSRYPPCPGINRETDKFRNIHLWV